MMKQKFLMILDEKGRSNMVGIIHYWHDEKNLTVEWISYLDVVLMWETKRKPNLSKSAIVSEQCEDINLAEVGEGNYKLHYTWYTVIVDFARAEKVRNEELIEKKD